MCPWKGGQTTAILLMSVKCLFQPLGGFEAECQRFYTVAARLVYIVAYSRSALMFEHPLTYYASSRRSTILIPILYARLSRVHGGEAGEAHANVLVERYIAIKRL